MNRFQLSNLEPSLQIQLFLISLFRLQKTLHSCQISDLVKMIPDAQPWQENLGVLHQLRVQANHLMNIDTKGSIESIIKTIDLAILECNEETFSEKRAEPLFYQTSEFLFAYEPDENLYYFLLRHQEECKKTFGRVFLLNLFKKKHQGLKQTEQFLIERYQQRGFFHLKPSIKNYLAGLTRC